MSEHELWNELGNLYFMSGVYNQAINAYQRSIQLDNKFGWPYSNLALVYVQKGEYDKAVNLYQKSIELLVDNKEKSIAWNRLGNVYRHLKYYREAVVAYQQADELDPNSIDIREETSLALHNVVNSSVTHEELIMIATNIKPNDEQEIVTTSDPNEVIPSLSPNKVTASCPDEDSTRDQQDASEKQEAISLEILAGTNIDCELAPSSSSKQDDDVYIPNSDNGGMADWLPIPEADPFDEAESLGIDQNLQGSDMRLNANYLTQDRGDPSCAITIYSPTIGNRIHWKKEYVEQSVKQTEIDVEELPTTTFVVAPEQDEQSINSQTEYGEHKLDDQLLENYTEKIKDTEVEISKYKRVVQINPRNAPAWSALGTLYKSEGLYKDAILAYQQAISIDSSKAFYHHHLALVYAADGRDEDAIITFQKVIELDPNHSLAHATLGGYYRKMGLEELAQKHIGKAMKNIYTSENEYNKACLAAICGNADQAIELLRVALENKQTYVNWIMHDPDLDTIREDARFKQLISDFIR